MNSFLALKIGQRHPLLEDLVPADTAQNVHFDALQVALDAGTGDTSASTEALERLLVSRRTLPVMTTQFAASLPDWSAGLKIDKVIGPIPDRLGREVWFDVFRSTRQVRFVRNPGAAPFLSLPMVQLGAMRFGGATVTSIKIGKGSLWLATRLLAAAAPDGVYTGLRITGGTLRFGQPVAVPGDEVVVPLGVVCDLVIETDPPATPGGAGPGQDVRDAAFLPPRKVTFRIDGAAAVVTLDDAAALRLYGQEVKLEPAGGAGAYLPTFNRVTVPLKPGTDPFVVGAVASAGFRPSGAAIIDGAAWALPAAVIAPADLGEASGVGALMLDLAPGLTTLWTGQTAPVRLGSTRLFLDESRLAVIAGAAQGYAVAQHPSLPGSLGRGRFDLTWAKTFPMSYFAQASGSEALVTAASVAVSLETPVDVNGDRIAANAPTAQVAFIETASGRFLLAQADIRNDDSHSLAFGLTNAVLRASHPIGFLLIAGYDGMQTGAGALSIGYALFGLLPSLPDPYATNVTAGRGRERGDGAGGARLTSITRWTDTAASLEFLLPAGTFVPTATFAGSDAMAAPRSSSSIRAGGPSGAAGMMAFVSDRAAVFNPAEESATATKALGDALEFERQPRLILLDVSSNVSQFGVALRPPSDRRSDVGVSQAGGVQPLAVKGLDLVADGRLMVLVTLPAVQWEPAEGEPVQETPPFPPRVTFANSGVPTVIDVPTVNLVPVTPAAALDDITKNFAAPDPRPARARFTLPFGMIGHADLREAKGGRGAKVSEVRPASADGLLGGRQLRIEAVDPTLAPEQTPGLPGYAVQLPVAIPADGSPGPRSILGTSVSNIFNGYLGAGAPTALVPVTRIDISGYGESMFSGWINPTAGETDVAKADFKVMMGRTALEVVQVRSILLPYRVPVVRTITLERKNNAVITRHDSGWVAAGDGAYRFGPASGIVTHPGVVRRIANVTHIRETGERVTKSGIEFVGVYYQGALEIDGAAAPVPVSQHFGFVKIGIPVLTPAIYAELLADRGPLGGSLDANIGVGGGAQTMRLKRVGVGVTQAASGPEFVMTVWGGLVFPKGGGDWSVLQAEDAAGAPGPVPQDEGLPLIRAGAADGPPPTAPYRFADPADLARESTPERDFGILHATGTQRTFFRRPKIEAASLSRIVSTERPVIADPYVLATALGPFPLQSDAIPFPAASWALAVSAAGDYRLEMPSSSFPAGIGRRTMRQAGSVKSDLDYSASVVSYEVDTAQPVGWRFSLSKAAKIMNSPAMGDMITLTADVAAEAGRETVFTTPKMRLGGSLTIVQDLLTILEDLGISGILTTAMTNEWSLKMAVRIPFVDAMGKDLQIPPFPDPLPVIKFADTGIKVEIGIAPSADSAAFEMGGSPMFAIKQIPGLYVVAIIKFKIKLSTADGTTYEVLIGLGVAYEIEAGPFELKGLIAITFFVVWGDTVLGYGVGFLVKVSAAIEPIISVELTLEGRLARIVVNQSLPDETVFAAAKLTFAIEVSIFLVLNISVEFETTQVNIISGPLPETALPDIL